MSSKLKSKLSENAAYTKIYGVYKAICGNDRAAALLNMLEPLLGEDNYAPLTYAQISAFCKGWRQPSTIQNAMKDLLNLGFVLRSEEESKKGAKYYYSISYSTVESAIVAYESSPISPKKKKEALKIMHSLKGKMEKSAAQNLTTFVKKDTNSCEQINQELPNNLITFVNEFNNSCEINSNDCELNNNDCEQINQELVATNNIYNNNSNNEFKDEGKDSENPQNPSFPSNPLEGNDLEKEETNRGAGEGENPLILSSPPQPPAPFSHETSIKHRNAALNEPVINEVEASDHQIHHPKENAIRSEAEGQKEYDSTKPLVDVLEQLISDQTAFENVAQRTKEADMGEMVDLTIEVQERDLEERQKSSKELAEKVMPYVAFCGEAYKCLAQDENVALRLIQYLAFGTKNGPGEFVGAGALHLKNIKLEKERYMQEMVKPAIKSLYPYREEMAFVETLLDKAIQGNNGVAWKTPAFPSTETAFNKWKSERNSLATRKEQAKELANGKYKYCYLSGSEQCIKLTDASNYQSEKGQMCIVHRNVNYIFDTLCNPTNPQKRACFGQFEGNKKGIGKYLYFFQDKPLFLTANEYLLNLDKNYVTASDCAIQSRMNTFLGALESGKQVKVLGFEEEAAGTQKQLKVYLGIV